MNEKLFKGTKVKLGEQIGFVLCYYGKHAVQVATVRVHVLTEGFPARVVGEKVITVKECWPVARVEVVN